MLTKRQVEESLDLQQLHGSMLRSVLTAEHYRFEAVQALFPRLAEQSSFTPEEKALLRAIQHQQTARFWLLQKTPFGANATEHWRSVFGVAEEK